MVSKESLEKLSENNALEFPIKRNEDSFVKEVEIILKRVLNQYKKIIPEFYNKNKKKLVQFKKSIISSLNAQIKGEIKKSYVCFNSAMKNIESELFYIPYSPEHQESFYRIRVSSNQIYDHKEMFHIPISLQHKLENQRFSISGYPSLYCSSSIFTCWSELKHPDLNNVYISKINFNPPKVRRVLNLGTRINDFLWHISKDYANKTYDYDSDISGYLMTLPLSLICHFKVKHVGDPFKPEYLLPQYLLQWILAKEKYYGIRYFSTNVNRKNTSKNIVSNFVFPARNINKSGYSNDFTITKPISWLLFNNSITRGVGEVGDNRNFFLDDNFETLYQLTDFAKIEDYALRSREFYKVTI